jgi:L-cysteine S-thiosulfotransferase
MKRPWLDMKFIASLIAATALATCLTATAQTKSAADGIAEYRKMLEDGNPAELFEAKGEDIWKTARGPKKASLQACDLGLGPGVVKGAWVQMPRWFADTQRVQDLESRLLTCMENLDFSGVERPKNGLAAGAR